MHTLSTAEIFLPWNNTWLLLPPFPTLTDPHGRQWRITDAHIFSLNMAAGAYQLCLVGAVVYDVANSGVYPLQRVWCLQYNKTSADYHWIMDPVYQMGK